MRRTTTAKATIKHFRPTLPDLQTKITLAFVMQMVVSKFLEDFIESVHPLDPRPLARVHIDLLILGIDGFTPREEASCKAVGVP